MRFDRSRRPRLLALSLALSLSLLSTACVTASTKASRVRTDRPEMPTRDTNLTRTEKLRPLTAQPKPGDEVTISRTVLEELYQRFGEAIGAIERGNNRITGNNALWACVDAIWKTGKTPAGCKAK